MPHGQTLLMQRTQVAQHVFIYPAIDGGQGLVEGVGRHRRVHALGGQNAHKELEVFIVPHVLRPRVDTAPNDQTEVGKLPPILVHLRLHVTARKTLASVRLKINAPL